MGRQQWTKREHSFGAIVRAGRSLRGSLNPYELRDEMAILSNWKAAHEFPLNGVQQTLRTKAKMYSGSIVTQRQKRTASILYKLKNLTGNLREMQDLCACRAIMNSTEEVNLLVDDMVEGRFRSTLRRKNDYISKPRKSG